MAPGEGAACELCVGYGKAQRDCKEVLRAQQQRNNKDLTRKEISGLAAWLKADSQSIIDNIKVWQGSQESVPGTR